MWNYNKVLELIETVQHNHILYDTKAKNHRNKEIVEKTWSDVDFMMKTPRNFFPPFFCCQIFN